MHLRPHSVKFCYLTTYYFLFVSGKWTNELHENRILNVVNVIICFFLFPCTLPRDVVTGRMFHPLVYCSAHCPSMLWPAECLCPSFIFIRCLIKVNQTGRYFISLIYRSGSEGGGGHEECNRVTVVVTATCVGWMLGEKYWTVGMT